MAKQLSLLNGLAQSLARARFQHYNTLRELFDEHVHNCKQCRHVFHAACYGAGPNHLPVACDKGRELAQRMIDARNNSVGDIL